jgi:hypothetical protein
MGDRIPMHRRAAPGRPTLAARAWRGFPAARAAGAAPVPAGPGSVPAGAAIRPGAAPARAGAVSLRARAVSLRAGAVSLRAGAAPLRAGAAFPVGRAVTPVTLRALPGRLAGLVLAPLAPVIRWRAERRVLRELLAPYEAGGYQPSPPTWERLRAEARALTRS